MSDLLSRSLFSLGIILTMILCTPVYAGINLSINPLEGGSGIRFNRVLPGLKNTKQLQVRISSNDGKKYQVFQRVYEPIINEKGQPLNLSAIQVATLINSNTSGTLYMQTGDRLSYSEQLIYTSGQQGESDSFVLVYNANPELIKDGGNFRGRIIFSVRALGAAEQGESVVDFLLEGSSNLQVSIAGGRDPKRIRVKEDDSSQEKADFVRISFSNNGTQDIKIYQEFVTLPVATQSAVELPAGAIRISAEGSGSNVRSLNRDNISRNRVLVYSGQADNDDFVLYFLADREKLQQADAGRYVGEVKYTVETSQGRQEFSLNVDCEVRPVFMMDMVLPPEGVSFGRVLANSPAQEKEVKVTVRTNLHKPYQIVQNMSSLMTNQQGKEFDKNYFKFKVMLEAGQKGRTKYSDFSPAESGEYPIFYSDGAGSPVTFVVIYQLQGYLDMNPGNFVAPLKLTLNQN